MARPARKSRAPVRWRELQPSTSPMERFNQMALPSPRSWWMYPQQTPAARRVLHAQEVFTKAVSGERLCRQPSLEYDVQLHSRIASSSTNGDLKPTFTLFAAGSTSARCCWARACCSSAFGDDDVRRTRPRKTRACSYVLLAPAHEIMITGLWPGQLARPGTGVTPATVFFSASR